MQQSINDKGLFVDTVNQEFDNVDMELAALCSRYYYDPYGWVMHFFDWGHGELAGFDGPDEWQKELLQEVGRQSYDNAFDGVTPVAPQRHVRASGHGIGKSACTSWITLWIMSTRPFSKGTVTANTGTQLSTKTWAELGKWRKLCLTGHWFEYSGGAQSMKMYHKAHPSKWLVTAQTCREENSESFAGQHAPTGCSFYIFDEASAVPDKIYEVAEGGLTDGEPMIFLFGNPTRNTGVFAETFFKPRWNSKQIDSRSCKMTNKRTIDEWIEDHGEDSDFIRVRVKGQFPKAGAMQFFPSDLVDDAMNQPIPPTLPDDPLIMAFDVARGGGDDCRIGFRRGLDARSENSYRISYEDSRDATKVISKVIMVVERHKPDIILVDETGVGGPVLDRLRQLGINAHGVHFGGSADNKLRYENKTAEMADRLRQWLLSGGSIPNDEELKRQLVGREFWHNHKDQLVMERKDDMKKRLGCSPDWADQLYMLFAHAQFILINKKRDNLVAPHARKSMAHRESDPFKYM